MAREEEGGCLEVFVVLFEVSEEFAAAEEEFGFDFFARFVLLENLLHTNKHLDKFSRIFF